MPDRFYLEPDNLLCRPYPIYDGESEDDTIWIDCKPEYLDVIVDALNKMVSESKDG